MLTNNVGWKWANTVANRSFADISSNNRNPNFEQYRAGGSLIIGIKATEGRSYLNPLHHDWVHRAHVAGLSVIHYHFGRPDQNPGAAAGEAEWFWDHVREWAGPFDYLCVDLEREYAHLAWWAESFHNHITLKSRFDVLTYANRDFLSRYGAGIVPGKHRAWEADFSSAPDFAPPGCSVFARQHTDGVIGPAPRFLPGTGQSDVNTLNRKTYLYLLANSRRDHRVRH